MQPRTWILSCSGHRGEAMNTRSTSVANIARRADSEVQKDALSIAILLRLAPRGEW
jgi:hypothetical protein